MLKNCLRIVLFLSLLSAATSPTFACNLPPGSGFIIISIFDDFVLSPFGVESPIIDQLLMGDFVSPASAIGNKSTWEQTTDGTGEVSRVGYASPATWKINYESGPCSKGDPIVDGPPRRRVHICSQLNSSGDLLQPCAEALHSSQPE